MTAVRDLCCKSSHWSDLYLLPCEIPRLVTQLVSPLFVIGSFAIAANTDLEMIH